MDVRTDLPPSQAAFWYQQAIPTIPTESRFLPFIVRSDIMVGYVNVRDVRVLSKHSGPEPECLFYGTQKNVFQRYYGKRYFS